MVEKIARWLVKSSRTKRLALHSLAAGALGYAAALTGAQVAELLKAEALWVVALHALIATVVLGLFGFVIEVIRRGAEVLIEQRERVIVDAMRSLDRWVANDMEHLSQQGPPGKLADVPFAIEHHHRSMVNLAKALLGVFESHYSKGELPGERVSFEVSFMTESYRDGGITIAAWANSEGRAPPSLRTRDGNPGRYGETVTARMYEQERPNAIIVSDTSDPSTGYAELYGGELERIKSTIVYPVLSPDNAVLGTLVVHCDKTGFFRTEELQFLRSVLEPYAARFALARVQLDGFVKQGLGSLPEIY